MRNAVAVAAVIWLCSAAFAGEATTDTPPVKEKEPDAKNNVPTVPPPGVDAFDPKPLMDKLIAHTKTDKFRFVIVGDAKHSKALPALLKFLDETVNPDFVLTTGDMVSSGAGKVGPGYYEMLAAEAGPQMRKRPWWPAIGNHELAGQPITKDAQKAEGSEQIRKNQSQGIENFKKFYNLEDDHYSFTFRNSAFIALPFRYPVDKQIEWLEGELKKAAASKKHIFIFNHAPFFTAGNKPAKEIPNKETPVTKLFQDYKVKAIFSGHDHGFYRTIRTGIPYFTSAGGGAKLYPATRAVEKKEALPEDVYYYGVPETFKNGAKNPKFVLHKADGTERITDTPEQFFCVVDVDGDKVNCWTTSVKGEKWDEMVLSR